MSSELNEPEEVCETRERKEEEEEECGNQDRPARSLFLRVVLSL